MRRWLGGWVVGVLAAGVVAAALHRPGPAELDLASGGGDAEPAPHEAVVEPPASSTLPETTATTTTATSAPPSAPATTTTTTTPLRAPTTSAPPTSAPPPASSSGPPPPNADRDGVGDEPVPMRDLAIGETWVAHLSGSVVDAAGRPVVGACVEVVGGPLLDQHQPVATTRTDGAGRWVLEYVEHVVRNSPTVTARDCSGAVPGFGLVEVRPIVDIDVPEEVDLVVGAGAAVFGVVADGVGAPVAGACVVVHLWPLNPQYATTDALGRWVAPSLPAGMSGGYWADAVSTTSCGLSGHATTLATYTDRAALGAGEVRGPVILLVA